MAKELKKRSEVRVEDTWNTSDLYATVEDYQKDIEKIKGLGDKIASYKGQLNNAKKLLEVHDLLEESDLVLGRAYSYAARLADQDTANAENQARMMQARTVYSIFGSSISYINSEILAIGSEKIESFYKEEPGLEKYRLSLEEILRRAAHTLSAEEERIIALAGELFSAPSTIFSMFSNADLKFPVIKDETGEDVQITNGRYATFLNSTDRAVRANFFEKFYESYKAFRNTIAANYSTEVKKRIFNMRVRKYDNCLQAATDRNDVPESVCRNLIAVCNENVDKMYRYMEIRRKLLGYEELHMYDLHLPVIKGVDKKIPFEEAKKIVIEGLAPLGKDYQELLEKAFAERWIDIYENEGKRSGAYSSGCYGVHPYVLLNYDESLDSVFTLAHELGHAMHSYLSCKYQTPMNSGYKIFVAEVASICNEALLAKHMLKNAQTAEEKAYIINHLLDDYRTTFYRQTMFAEFELRTAEMAERGESLTADALEKLYYELNGKYYGPGVVNDDLIRCEWSRIPHFYMNFYVYQYATGFAAAMALSDRILKLGKEAADDYKKFLSGGCTKTPIELLKIAGVDMASKEPLEAALKVFDEMMDELEKNI
ncbi:MAG: oligoendopeptidase F [Lachnospiraceae bacterium]|nr:oligoendopeptidase F [Lachnospiraceae bacterium]